VTVDTGLFVSSRTEFRFRVPGEVSVSMDGYLRDVLDVSGVKGLGQLLLPWSYLFAPRR
jgi:hypothetical protein